MSNRQIIFSNDPRLHEPSRRVRRVDEGLQDLIDAMMKALREADGIGLAAVQIGVPERVVVIELPAPAAEDEVTTEEPPQSESYVLINPRLLRGSPEVEESIEGCLSIPGWVGEVERHRSIVVEALDEEGRELRIEAEGLLARVLQHEIDHCEGVLFIDRIEDPEKIWSVETGREEAGESGGG